MTTMTHRAIYDRLGRHDTQSFYWMAALFFGILAAIFLGTAFLPQSWLDALDLGGGAFTPIEPDDGTRFFLIPIMISTTLIVINLVTGIVSAAELRSYLGAGVTRRAMWWDGRRTNVGFTALMFALMVVATVVGYLLDSPQSSLGAGEWLLAAIVFLGFLLLAFEVGFVNVMLFSRHHWLIATILCVTYNGILVFTLGLFDNIWVGDWPWYNWLICLAIALVTMGISRALLYTMPMRRNY